MGYDGGATDTITSFTAFRRFHNPAGGEDISDMVRYIYYDTCGWRTVEKEEEEGGGAWQWQFNECFLCDRRRSYNSH